MTRRKRMLADLDQDIRDHLESETQDNIDRGNVSRGRASRGIAQVRKRRAGQRGDLGSVERWCGLSSCFRIFASAFVPRCEAQGLR